MTVLNLTVSLQKRKHVIANKVKRSVIEDKVADILKSEGQIASVRASHFPRNDIKTKS
jgi:hypothetical protein